MSRFLSIAATVCVLSLVSAWSPVSAEVIMFTDRAAFVAATNATTVPIPTSDVGLPFVTNPFNESCGSPEGNILIEPTGSGERVVLNFGAGNSLDFSGPVDGPQTLCIFDKGYLSFNTVPINDECGGGTFPTHCATQFGMPDNFLANNGADDFEIEFLNSIHAFGFQLVTNGGNRGLNATDHPGLFKTPSEVIETVTFCKGPLGAAVAVPGPEFWKKSCPAADIIDVIDISATTVANSRQFFGFSSVEAFKSVYIDTTITFFDDRRKPHPNDVGIGSRQGLDEHPDGSGIFPSQQNAGVDELMVGGVAFQVSINIKPGSDPNSINTCSGGLTPVTIFGSADLDVTTIDLDTLVLASAEVKTVGKKDPRILCNVEDVGSVDESAFDNLGSPDSFDDLTCHFITFELTDLTDASTSADLTGNFEFGTIVGQDAVNIVKDC